MGFRKYFFTGVIIFCIGISAFSQNSTFSSPQMNIDFSIHESSESDTLQLQIDLVLDQDSLYLYDVYIETYESVGGDTLLTDLGKIDLEDLSIQGVEKIAYDESNGDYDLILSIRSTGNYQVKIILKREELIIIESSLLTE